MKNTIILLLLIISINVMSKENTFEKFDMQSNHIHSIQPSTIKIDHFGYGESLIIYGSTKELSNIASFVNVLENDKKAVGAIVKTLEVKKNKTGEHDFKLSYNL